MDSSPPDARCFGLKPWFPWPLSAWCWLTTPVRAERLAALRIGLALIMLLDVLSSFYPTANDIVGKGSLGEYRAFDYRYTDGLRWSLFVHREEPEEAGPVRYRDASPVAVTRMMALWALASALLLIGFLARLAALWSFLMSVSISVSNYYVDNAGDTVRTLAMFYLALSPCGAAWSVEAWLRRRFSWMGVRTETGEFRGVALMRRDPPGSEPYLVQPWPLRLLFMQMMIVYLFNGLYKATGETWHAGSSLHNVLGDLTLTRWSYAMLPLPLRLTRAVTLLVLWWELLLAPVMLVPWHTLSDLWKRMPHVGRGHILFRWTREIFLVFGVLFHVGILVSMEIGGFAPYMLCLYLPLLPWERSRWGTSVSRAALRPDAGAPG